ncbi:uncharacterized protein sS8_1202 [Methylocaldum marinum]|uniref:Uncharacterized protein n=1 Tax=Methylocaldum marinum TaxID=1432792 RepID=A0A250KNN7_9GAMM|nr:hypothetical protein [Methylocaldum marinum]BBA33164.1 uncharacterized protein sS8_1202 [Methylocaldum marinum]
MAKKHFGKLPPRYLFALNPYTDTRCSRCPKCDRPTYKRKFPLLMTLVDHGLFILGKTCRYCPKCEFIIAHKDELENVLVSLFPDRTPEQIGKDYFVIGTIDTRTWRKGMEDPSYMRDLNQIKEHAADIKRYMVVKYDPGGWRFTGEKKA